MRLLYLIYLIEWKRDHRGKAFKGCSPVCYQEWGSYEFQDMMKYPDHYKGKWYYFVIQYLRERQSKEV